MDVNCGTIPSPPMSLCPPYPSLFPPPPSPSELGFYSAAAAAHHSAFPFLAAATAANPAGTASNPSPQSNVSNTLASYLLQHQSMAAAAAAINAAKNDHFAAKSDHFLAKSDQFLAQNDLLAKTQPPSPPSTVVSSAASSSCSSVPSPLNPKKTFLLR